MKAADLRKAILQYAVEGKLVPQDNQDEPASILYEKIIAEKENLIKQGKIKKEKPLPPITDDDIPYEIPENWKWVRLGEVCEIKRGNGLTKNDFTDSGIPCIHYGQIHKYYKYSTHTTLSYTSEQVAYKLKTVDYTDIIMVITSENINDVCKSIAWLGNYQIVTGGHTAIIKHWINPLYLIYLFNSNCFQLQKNKIAKGMKVIEVSSEKLKHIIFPLPPLKEQERIVKKVDELMGLCDKLEQEEEKLLVLDKNFMENLPKSILQYAVEGKLVLQDIHDEPASLLYDKIIKEKENLIKQGKIKKEKPLPPITDDEIPYDIPNNWKWVRLGEVCDLYTGNSINAETKNKKYANLSQGYNYIATKDVNFNTTIDYNNGIKIPFNEINFKIAKKNTILLCIEGGSAGRKIGFLNQDVCFGNKLCNINGLLLHNQYLFYLAQSPIFLSIFNANKAGIIGGVSVNLIKNIIFPLPPLKEQERIIKKVDELLTYCEKLKDIV